MQNDLYCKIKIIYECTIMHIMNNSNNDIKNAIEYDLLIIVKEDKILYSS